jgi:hypothetical protein
MKPYTVSFTFRGVPLEARRLREGVAPSTLWNFEDFAVAHPAEPGQPIDQIQLYFDRSSGEWSHWGTKFSTDHKELGKALAVARTQSPELHTYSVLVELHKHSDLSDRPTNKRLPVEATNPSEAVYKLREIVGRDNEIVLRSGTKKYIGRVHLTQVSGPL